MVREPTVVETIARHVDLPPGQVLHVLDYTFRELHRRIYEYDGMNGDYICEELIHELSEMAWIHLYLFLAYYGIKYDTACAEDVLPDRYVQLQYLGNTDRWQKYLDEAENWKMSRHLRNLLRHEG